MTWHTGCSCILGSAARRLVRGERVSGGLVDQETAEPRFSVSDSSCGGKCLGQRSGRVVTEEKVESGRSCAPRSEVWELLNEVVAF